MRPHLGPRRVCIVRVPADIDVDALAARDGYTVRSTWLADLVAVNTDNHKYATGPRQQPQLLDIDGSGGLPEAVSLPSRPTGSTSPASPMVRHTMRLTTAIDATAHAHRAGYRSVSRWVSDLVVATAGRLDRLQGADLGVTAPLTFSTGGAPLRTIA